MTRYEFRVTRSFGSETIKGTSWVIEHGGVLVIYDGAELVKAFARHAWVSITLGAAGPRRAPGFLFSAFKRHKARIRGVE